MQLRGAAVAFTQMQQLRAKCRKVHSAGFISLPSATRTRHVTMRGEIRHWYARASLPALCSCSAPGP